MYLARLNALKHGYESTMASGQKGKCCRLTIHKTIAACSGTIGTFDKSRFWAEMFGG